MSHFKKKIKMRKREVGKGDEEDLVMETDLDAY